MKPPFGGFAHSLNAGIFLKNFQFTLVMILQSKHIVKVEPIYIMTRELSSGRIVSVEICQAVSQAASLILACGR